MFLQPKKRKYKKEHKGRLKNLNYKSNKIILGNTALQACESGLISAKQIESARQAINRKIKRKGKLWIKIFPNHPITKKPTEVRMGKGKGQVSYWSAKIKSGTILFEMAGIPLKKAVSAFSTGGAKLPLKTKIVEF
jgi:large subunit ribosomal protein L16